MTDWHLSLCRGVAGGLTAGLDSLEEDSIFSLGKIVCSPRYGQYPDLSDEEEGGPGAGGGPVSLPHIRPGPASAPPARLPPRPATCQHPLHTARSASQLRPTETKKST